MIRKEKAGYKVISEKGKNLGGNAESGRCERARAGPISPETSSGYTRSSGPECGELTTGFSTGDGEIHRKIRENLFPQRLTWPKNLIYSPDVTGALSRRKSGDSRVCPLI
jgi:hypothetical protein